MCEVAAVDGGRLLQVNRNSLDKSFYQEDSHRKSEGNIWQKQGKPLVGNITLFEYDIDRNEQRVNRDQHAHQEHNIQDTVQLKAYPCKDVAYDKAECNDQQDR